MDINWNLWHGCQKISPGCQNCYVYRRDSQYDITNAFIVHKTADFNLPLRKDRQGNYKIPAGTTVFACMTSDFFVEDADMWRPEAWEIIRTRKDLHFFIITKRIHRAAKCLPQDWGNGWDNVTIAVTCENQAMADFRLPIYMNIPVKSRYIMCEPLLEKIDLSKYLDGITSVTAGGESGENARICDYDWVLSIRDQCASKGIGFWFKQTGANFRKDGKIYRIPRKLQHEQARKANINIIARR